MNLRELLKQMDGCMRHEPAQSKHGPHQRGWCKSSKSKHDQRSVPPNIAYDHELRIDSNPWSGDSH